MRRYSSNRHFPTGKAIKVGYSFRRTVTILKAYFTIFTHVIVKSPMVT
jgi:hypothetical protein